jgi:TP901 family phage tail tape measure protein
MSTFVIPTIFTAIDQMTSPLKKMGKGLGDLEARSDRLQRSFRRVSESSRSIAIGTGIAATAILTPLVMMGKSAVDFEDKMADVAKTTGLVGKDLKGLGADILKISTGTRTSIESLQDIGRIGGQMGVAKEELKSFIKTADQFNVSLGDDFAGGTEEAVTSVAKLQSLFKETRDLDISESITKAGSVINALSASGKSTSQNINEFLLRIGALPDALKPSIESTAALGAVLEESGVSAEIGARAFGILITTAGLRLGDFSKQMGLSQKAASDLLASNPTLFASKFSESLKGLKPEVLAAKLKQLGIGATGVIKVVGALGSNTQRLADIQKISNDEFQKGTSLLNEFNVKNNTTAAQIAKAENNFKALSIVVGTKLIPIVTKLLEKVTPVINSFMDWAEQNPETLSTIVKVAVGIGVLMGAISVISAVVSIATGVMAAFNLVLLLNPVGLIVLGIIALGAAIAAVIIYFEDWGSAALGLFSFISLPFTLIIGLIMSIKRNWDMLTEAFTTGGIGGAILAIGAVLLDVILHPLQQIFELMENVPGLDFGLSDKIAGLRADIGIDAEAINPKAVEQDALTERITENTNKETVDVNVNVTGGEAEVTGNSSDRVGVQGSTLLGGI